MDTYKTVAILGRQPSLGLAELERLYGAESLQRTGNVALLKTPIEEIDFRRLGGTIKLARLLTTVPTAAWPAVERYLVKTVPEYLTAMPEGKFTLGLSGYNGVANANAITKTALKIKMAIKKSGRPVRIVSNKTSELNSAQVLHNKLTTKGAWELLCIKDGSQTIIAQTFFVQDIEAYAARDQARPKRDAKVGMLPPKLAQIIINLANPAAKATLLDPFCGTGVILQEALLMGYPVIGTDLEPRMVEFSRKNLDWLKEGRSLPSYKLEAADALHHNWGLPLEAVAAETYLGKPLQTLPNQVDLELLVTEISALHEQFLRNLAPQLAPSATICLALPAWKTAHGFVHLPVLDLLTDLGYNRWSFVHAKTEDLIYFREEQIVGRELVVLTKA